MSVSASRPTEQLALAPPRFLGEQNGLHEQRLKQALADLLKREATVAKAWLCRIAYDDDTTGVALGLKTDRGEREQLVERIGAIFASMFNRDAHLDVIFLSDRRHAEIEKVCPAFYQRTDRRWW